MDAGAKERTYKIGQAAKLLDVKPFVLRFWEGEFTDVLVPVRTPAGQRAYTEANIATVREIKRLLYEEGLTIEGAKKRLSAQAESGQPAVTSAAAMPSTAASPDAAPSRDAALPLLQPTLPPAAVAGPMPAATAQAIASAKARGAAEAGKSARAALAAADSLISAAEVRAAKADARAGALARALADAARELAALRDMLR